MKTIYLSLILLIMMSSCSAPKEILPDNYEKIIEVQEVSKEKLYIKANAWFVETFNSSESVIEFQDKDEGKIIGKYASQTANSGDFYGQRYRTIISVDIQNNKLRIKFYNAQVFVEGWRKYVPIHSTINGSVSVNRGSRLLARDLIPQWKSLIKNLEIRLNEESDW